MGLCYSHHKTELIIEQRTSRVLHNLGLQLGVSARHQVDPHEGVRGANEIFLGQGLTLHHGDVKLLSSIVVPDLFKLYNNI